MLCSMLAAVDHCNHGVKEAIMINHYDEYIKISLSLSFGWTANTLACISLDPNMYAHIFLYKENILTILNLIQSCPKMTDFLRIAKYYKGSWLIFKATPSSMTYKDINADLITIKIHSLLSCRG